jgi:hypothetical protein
MPANYFNPRGNFNQGLVKGITTQIIRTSDCGRLLYASSNHVMLVTTGDTRLRHVGYVAAVVTPYSANTVNSATGGTTDGNNLNVFYYRKLDPSIELEVSYVTSNGHYGTSDIGKHTGLDLTYPYMSKTILSDAASSVAGTWLRITGFSTNRSKVYGYPVLGSNMVLI